MDSFIVIFYTHADDNAFGFEFTDGGDLLNFLFDIEDGLDSQEILMFSLDKNVISSINCCVDELCPHIIDKVEKVCLG